MHRVSNELQLVNYKYGLDFHALVIRKYALIKVKICKNEYEIICSIKCNYFYLPNI